MTWTSWAMDLARHSASRSKDASTKVGAVIMDGNRVVSMGYNGPPAGVDDAPTDRATKLMRTIHAELNAVLFAKRNLDGCTIYVTHHPCAQCAAVIAQTGITRVVYDNEMSDKWEDDTKEARWIFNQRGITLERIK